MGDGIELRRVECPDGFEWDWWIDDENPATHIAYPADVARARERVVEAAKWLDRTLSPESRAGLHAALADLDAAEGGVGK